jgi:uncharacterized protein GlcG (DUF336 family)
MLTVNLETARHIIKSAEAKAESLGCAMNTAVVDAGGNLVAHVRCAPGPSRSAKARCRPRRASVSRWRSPSASPLLQQPTDDRP